MQAAWNDLLLMLAVFRITLMLTREAGPGHVFERLRVRLGVAYDAYSAPYATGFWSQLLLCPWCLSVWVAAFYLGATLLLPAPMQVLSLLLAASAVTVVLSHMLEK